MTRQIRSVAIPGKFTYAVGQVVNGLEIDFIEDLCAPHDLEFICWDKSGNEVAHIINCPWYVIEYEEVPHGEQS